MKASEVVVSDQVREQMAAFIIAARWTEDEKDVLKTRSRFAPSFGAMITARDALIAAIIEANP